MRLGIEQIPVFLPTDARIDIYTYTRIIMKKLRFVGTARDDLSAFPSAARSRAGQELFMVQVGRDPDDWKPIGSVGPGACEIRVRSSEGEKTSRRDLDLARSRYRDAKAFDEE